jgi:alkanesulfonate monooxygenase SsuD/methylene tetrahydromethanopterin reductase-like flavin-dependent oxidoreductase (luciferase family)
VHLSGAGHVAAEAERAEQLGFDLVAVDRDVVSGPPQGLEVWTTLTWVAARTSRITVVPNVLALPNRHPALLAKMAETLDRLSRGRVVLALGAGAPLNDPRVHALGLRGWSPAERVEATEEALDVIRGLWTDADFSYAGKHFTIEHAGLEPRPQQRIPVWLGAYRPRMLALTGRKADGWIPSLSWLEPAAAHRALERVRAAAVQAGRDADALTYAYNVGVLVDEHGPPERGRLVGGPERLGEALAEFVRHGFTALIVWPSGDTAEQIERLARDVIPAVHARLR